MNSSIAEWLGTVFKIGNLPLAPGTWSSFIASLVWFFLFDGIDLIVLPIITIIDTPGAYPGIGAEERGQGQAIASNLILMSKLKVPIISVVIGEGASGGALAIGLSDKILCFKNTWYSVISPEGCASILFRDAKRAEDAAEALKPTPTDLKEVGICERIIEEPNGGAHRDFESSASLLKSALIDELDKLSNVNPNEFLDNRINKYDALGYFEEG